jgi:predicted GNAT family acetyltransferase
LGNYQVKLNKKKEQFEVALDGKTAVIEFMLSEEDKHIIFTHTEVPEEHSGKGIASAMAKSALEYAKEHDLKVTSHCGYIDTYLERHPEFKELLK